MKFWEREKKIRGTKQIWNVKVLELILKNARSKIDNQKSLWGLFRK